MMKTASRKKNPSPSPLTTRQGARPRNDSDLPSLLRRVRNDHVRFRELVLVVDRKSRLKGRLRPGDYHLLRDIVAYMHDYPLGIHHPVENRICALLQEKRPSTAKTLLPLVNDHEGLEAETRHLMSLLDRAIAAPDGDLDAKIRACCTSYAAHQLGHMEKEEQTLFPLARKLLTATDWETIEQSVMADRDPLFGAIVDNRFRLLHEYLIESPDEDYENRARSAIVSTERAMKAAAVFGEGFSACRGQVRAFRATLRREARNALGEVRAPKSKGSRLLVPARFTGTIGKSLAGHCREIFTIAATTARDAAGLHRQRQ